jgi:hypothetical protein
VISQRTFERVLDCIAIVAGVLFLALTLAGVLSLSDTGWSIGLFTGWLLRHLLDQAKAP